MMSNIDWSEAPDWATCVVLNKTTNTFAWSDGSIHAPILRNPRGSGSKIIKRLNIKHAMATA